MTKIINLQSKIELIENYNLKLRFTVEDLEEFNVVLLRMISDLAFSNKLEETANKMIPGEAITVTNEMLSSTGDNNIDQLLEIRDLIDETTNRLRQENNIKFKHREIYIPAQNVRYALGNLSYNNFVIFGINPSKATNVIPDLTISKIKTFAENEHCDGWLMLNLYPQIATNPKCLDNELNESYHESNLKIIHDLFKELGPQPEIFAGWGNLIKSRSYFKKCLKDIYEITKQYNPMWLHFDTLTNDGHPKHPSRLGYEVKKFEFDIETYINNL